MKKTNENAENVLFNIFTSSCKLSYSEKLKVSCMSLFYAFSVLILCFGLFDYLLFTVKLTKIIKFDPV